ENNINKTERFLEIQPKNISENQTLHDYNDCEHINHSHDIDGYSTSTQIGSGYIEGIEIIHGEAISKVENALTIDDSNMNNNGNAVNEKPIHLNKSEPIFERSGIKIYSTGTGYLARINTGDDAYSKELTNFTLIPTLLINEQTKQEEYIVDVKFEGQIYRNRRISIANLNSPNTLKIALGIMGLVVTATTYEYSVLQMAFRKLVRQEIRASDILGLHDSCFLIPNGVITKEGLTKGKMIQ